jgi:hypothetical protein
VFQGRYKGILAQRETYMLELTRYVVLNPVRAGFVALPEEWPWSSYLYFIGQQPAPAWLDIRSTLTKFATEPVAAANAYRQFVISGIGKPSPLLKVKYQLVLGDEQFISELQRQAPGGSHRAVAKVQRRATCRTLEEYLHEFGERDEAMAQAYHSTAYTMEQIGNYFGVSAKTVSRAAKKFQLN